MRDVYILSQYLIVCSAESALLHIKIDESLMKHGGGCVDFAKLWRCCTTKLQVCEHYNK